MWLIILGLVGFIISYYILYKKKRNEKLVCIIGENCDKVIRSKYANTFGFDNTMAGMGYYGLVAVTGIAEFIMPDLFFLKQVILSKIIISGAAALFSIYLIFIQAFVLKEWCEYCLATSAISIAVFLVIIL